MQKIVRITERDLSRIVKRVINESSNVDEVKKMTDVQDEIERILSYYSIKDNKVWDNEYNKEVSPQTLKQMGPYYKAKIESVYVGCEEDGKNPSSLDSIKQEIINGSFKDLIGEYDNIPIEKNQFMDYYSDIKCHYYRLGKDKYGNPLNIENRPWCAK